MTVSKHIELSIFTPAMKELYNHEQPIAGISAVDCIHHVFAQALKNFNLEKHPNTVFVIHVHEPMKMRKKV